MKSATTSAGVSSSILHHAFYYFAAVFTVAFFLGTIRVLVLVPRIGEIAAVLLETPVILTVAWKSLKRAVRRMDRRAASSSSSSSLDTPTYRLAVGAAAFLFLMLAELLLSVTAFGRTPSQFLKEITSSPPHVIGLMGQVLFGLFPLVELRVGKNGNLQSPQKKHRTDDYLLSTLVVILALSLIAYVFLELINAIPSYF